MVDALRCSIRYTFGDVLQIEGELFRIPDVRASTSSKIAIRLFRGTQESRSSWIAP